MKGFIIAAIMAGSLQVGAHDTKLEWLSIHKNVSVIKLLVGIGGGTGFYISPNEIISAGHVCEHNIKVSNGSSIIKKVISKKDDLCYIEVDEGPHSYLELAHNVELYDEACMIGWESVVFYMVTCGKIVGVLHMVDEFGSYQTLIVNDLIYPGMSGGPTLSNGKVIGVIVMSLQPALRSYIVGIDSLISFIERARYEN